jgi:hypothetical protein
VLADIALGEAEPVGDEGELAVLLQRLGEASAHRMDRHREEAELHGHSSLAATTAATCGVDASVVRVMFAPS